MIESRLAHFSLVVHDGAVRAVVRFNDAARARAARDELGYGHVRAAQLSVGGSQLMALYSRLPGASNEEFADALREYTRTHQTRVGEVVDLVARNQATAALTRTYQAALAEAGIDD
jgi:hypothetical protein